jgi:hypothetical protein
MKIEQLKYDDIPSIIGLSASVGWDYTYEEAQVFLAAGKVFGHRESNGRIVSCAGVFAYGSFRPVPRTVRRSWCTSGCAA